MKLVSAPPLRLCFNFQSHKFNSIPNLTLDDYEAMLNIGSQGRGSILIVYFIVP
jgi:hypothetical protein